MRQSGLLAAGALYALQHHRQRLAEDHANAKRLAERLAKMSAIDIDPASIETNIVRFRVPGQNAAAIECALMDRGIAVMAVGSEAIRVVTHLMITEDDVDQAAADLEKLI